jgi:hypothetical protein
MNALIDRAGFRINQRLYLDMLNLARESKSNAIRLVETHAA